MTIRTAAVLVCAIAVLGARAALAAAPLVKLTGEIRDAATGELLPARLYIASSDGWAFARSADPQGQAIEYRKERNGLAEMHTSLSAHPFTAELPPGKYTLVAEHGKDFLPAEVQVELKSEPVSVRLELKRWIDVTRRGWYSGDTHVHRALADLPLLVMSEDLNVALPLTGWVRDADESPLASYAGESGEVASKLIRVDATHVIWPLNTEWEIFRVSGKSHTLGAVFALGHKQPFDLGVPPVRTVAAEARRQGALLDLDKHNWPWSMMIVPIMQVDLFELANNHVWRAGLGFAQFNNQYAPAWMKLETNDRGFTEWGWIDFGFQSYYMLLNCGFRLRPSAGTASGVHPVPLGFGRVYVELPDGFSYKAWMDGLDAGRSFVTTGPMLFVRANDRPAGTTFKIAEGEKATCRLSGEALSPQPLERIEVIAAGRVVETLMPANEPRDASGFRSPIAVELPLESSSWVAVRCLARLPDGRIRFAHTSPFHFELAGRPLVPRKVETSYLVGRIKDELKRHAGVLSPEAIEEYRQALAIYQKLDAAAR